MSDWRRTAKTITTTFLVTSAAWLIGGAVFFARMQENYKGPPANVSNADPAPAPADTQTGVVLRPAAPFEQPTLAAAVMAPVSTGKLVIPVAGVRGDQLVDTFTQSRGGGARVHNAIDIMAPTGTPVVAAAAGQVEKLFVSKLGGNTVYVRSPDRRLIYYYAHLDSYAPGLAAGRQVRQGEPIGTVGYSGDANPAAPHLHFEIQQTTPQSGWWQHSVSLNPYPLLTRR